jgi:hypothetical protein
MFSAGMRQVVESFDGKGKQHGRRKQGGTPYSIKFVCAIARWGWQIRWCTGSIASALPLTAIYEMSSIEFSVNT